MHLKRVKGGLREVLQLPGGGIPTVLGESFEVPDADGTRLLADGTERFEPADAHGARPLPSRRLKLDDDDTDEPVAAGEP